MWHESERAQAAGCEPARLPTSRGGADAERLATRDGTVVEVQNGDGRARRPPWPGCCRPLFEPCRTFMWVKERTDADRTRAPRIQTRKSWYTCDRTTRSRTRAPAAPPNGLIYRFSGPDEKCSARPAHSAARRQPSGQPLSAQRSRAAPLHVPSPGLLRTHSSGPAAARPLAVATSSDGATRGACV